MLYNNNKDITRKEINHVLRESSNKINKQANTTGYELYRQSTLKHQITEQ